MMLRSLEPIVGTKGAYHQQLISASTVDPVRLFVSMLASLVETRYKASKSLRISWCTKKRFISRKWASQAQTKTKTKKNMQHTNKFKVDLLLDMHNDKCRANSKNISAL